MPEIEVSAHCRFYIRYHIVWIVKYRKMLLTEPVVQKLLAVFNEIGRNYELPLEEVGTDGDHVHLFCQGHNDITPGRIVNIYKSISAREVLRDFLELKQHTLGSRLWGVGYYIATVGHSTNEKAIRAYVRNQGKGKRYEDYKQLTLAV